jgi:hypothetical protein
MVAMRRYAALSALLLAIALLAPRLALAHGGEHHGSAKHADAQRAFLLPSCPGQHGDFCTCGDPVACTGSATIALAPAPLALLALVAPARGEPRRESLARGPPAPFSLRFSRAPPASS